MIVIPFISYSLTCYLYKKIFQEGWFKTIVVMFIVIIALMLLSLIMQLGLTVIFMFT